MQLPLFTPQSNWRAPDILPDWESADAIVIDLETNDPNLKLKGSGWARKDGHVAGIAIGLVHGAKCHTYYLPIGHQMGGNLDKDRIIEYMDEICCSSILKVFHNGIYDIGWLSTLGIKCALPIFDTMFGASLLDENRISYSLDNLAKDWCNSGKDEVVLREAASAYGVKPNLVKSQMWKLPPQFVGPYAEQDVVATHKLWVFEEAKFLEDKKLNELKHLEMDLIPLWVAMRTNGVRVNEDKADELVKHLNKELVKTHDEIFKKHGVKINIWAAESIKVAFDQENLKYPQTPTGKPSFTKEFLIAHPHELPKTILRARNVEKTINTFLIGMIKDSSVNGRIFTEFHPLKSDGGGAVSGRVSSSNPNLQQTSARHPEFGPMIRGLFLPEEGTRWGALDYSSQEPRLTVHYAHVTGQIGASDAVENYRRDPRTDYHQMVAELCGIERKPAKTINLGLAYGMGEVKLCHSLGLPTEMVEGYGGNMYEAAGTEGRELIAGYHENVPFIKGLTEQCSNRASTTGSIRTLGGRLCRFNQWEPVRGKGMPTSDKDKAQKDYGKVRRAYTHKALNRLIQGSAADMTKFAMREIHKEGIVPMLQMHDELDFSFDNEATAKQCVEIMENCVKLEVPVIVDAEYGNTWADAVHKW